MDKSSKESSGPPPEALLRRWRTDPVAFAREYLGCSILTPKQEEILRAIEKYPKVAVQSGHGIGKTWIASVIAVWFYVCFTLSQTITSAPNAESVEGLLWGELRRRWGNRPGILPRSPELQDPEQPKDSHYVKGLTAKTGTSFQGRHAEFLLIIFDEALGIERQFYTAADNMCIYDSNRWFIIFNPTDTATAAYAATQNRKEWHVIEASALEHPNVLAELRGEPPPIPGATSLKQVLKYIENDSVPIPAEEAIPERDFEWPPGSGEWRKPGYDMSCRVLGRWPSSSTDSVWNEDLWLAALTRKPVPTFTPPEIGCDVAAKGSNNTTIHVRRGPCSLHHESHNGWDTTRIASRLRELADEYGKQAHLDGRLVLVKVDETGGYGQGVLDQAAGYMFVGIHSSHKALDEVNFPNRRSELWFTGAAKAKTDQVDLTRLDGATLTRLRAQLFAPRWETRKGQRVVEEKKETIKRIGSSPDDADAFNLAFAGAAMPMPLVNGQTASGGWSK